jgi:hypothetical protein
MRNRLSGTRTGGRRACLCPDGTYSKDCCDGSIWAQGIGVIIKAPTTYDLFIPLNSDSLITSGGLTFKVTA